MAISAIDSDDFTAQRKALPLAPVAGLSVVLAATTANSVELAWDAYTGNKGFSVYYSTASGFTPPAGTEFPPSSESPLADGAMGVEVTGLDPDTILLLSSSGCERHWPGCLLRGDGED